MSWKNKFWINLIFIIFYTNLLFWAPIENFFIWSGSLLKRFDKWALPIEKKVDEKLEEYFYPITDRCVDASRQVRDFYYDFYDSLIQVFDDFVNSSFMAEVFWAILLSVWAFILVYLFNSDYIRFVFDFHIFFLIFYISIDVTFLTAFSKRTKRFIGFLASKHLTIWLYSGFILLIISHFMFDFMYEKFVFFNGMYVIDSGSFFMRIWIIFFSIIAVNLSKLYIKNSTKSLVEMPVLFSIGVCFSVFTVSLVDLFSIIIVFEVLSIIILGLCGLSMERQSAEASVKYFVQNAVITGLVLFGVFWTYFIFKSTNLLFINYAIDLLVIDESLYQYVKPLFTISISLWLLGFFFKLGLFPVNFYVPDTYDAASAPVLFFMSSVIKPSVFYLFVKIFNIMNFTNDNFLIAVVVIVCVISIFLGDIMSLGSEKIKRFLGYSSISQYGFLTLAITTCVEDAFVFSFIYIFIYNIALISISLVLLERYTTEIKAERFYPVYFSELNFFFDNKPLLKFVVTFSLLIMSGIPPFTLFFCKYGVFLTLFNSSNYVLLIAVAISSIFSITYYFRIIADIWVYNSSKRNNEVEKKITFSKNYVDGELYIHNIFALGSIILNILTFVLFFVYFDSLYEFLMLLGFGSMF